MADRELNPTESPQGSLELTEELIRQRAYGFYEQRGREDGHDLEDWLRAEAEIFGKKTSHSEPAIEQKILRTAAAA